MCTLGKGVRPRVAAGDVQIMIGGPKAIVLAAQCRQPLVLRSSFLEILVRIRSIVPSSSW